MSVIASPQDVARLGTILCVGAHPDDETWMAGGIMAAAAANGQRVIVVTATQGEAGTTDTSRWPQEDLGIIRTRELHAALQVLGVYEHGLLDCEDGKCAVANAQDVALQLAGLIHSEQPDTILTFGPDGLTGHDDHKTVSRWCDMACALIDHQPAIYHAACTQAWYDDYGKELDAKANVFFAIDRPPIVEASALAIDFHLPTEIAHKKLRALQAQPSQMEALLAHYPAGQLPPVLSQECFVLSM